MLIFQKLKGFISFILLFFLTIISLNAQVNKSINTNSKKDFDEGNIEEREKWFYGQRAYPYPSIPQESGLKLFVRLKEWSKDIPNL